MVADEVTVTSRAYGTEEAHVWNSRGADGYTVSSAEKAGTGTEILLHIKPMPKTKIIPAFWRNTPSEI